MKNWVLLLSISVAAYGAETKVTIPGLRIDNP